MVQLEDHWSVNRLWRFVRFVFGLAVVYARPRSDGPKYPAAAQCPVQLCCRILHLRDNADARIFPSHLVPGHQGSHCDFLWCRHACIHLGKRYNRNYHWCRRYSNGIFCAASYPWLRNCDGWLRSVEYSATSHVYGQMGRI